MEGRELVRAMEESSMAWDLGAPAHIQEQREETVEENGEGRWLLTARGTRKGGQANMGAEVRPWEELGVPEKMGALLQPWGGRALLPREGEEDREERLWRLKMEGWE
jgi:hypothetical protein